MADCPTADPPHLSLVCGDVVLDAGATYQTFVKSVVEASLSDSEADVVLTGAGFDKLPVLHTIHDYGGRRYILRSRAGRPTLYVVHNACAVLDDPAVEYKSGKPVLLYASPAGLYSRDHGYGVVILHLSCRTYSVVQREDYGIPLREGVVVRMDSTNVPKFHLSSAEFLEMFSRRQFLVSDSPAVPLDLRTLWRSEVYEEADTDSAGLWYEAQNDSVTPARVVPAFRYAHWPANMVDWMSRNRVWPKNDVMRHVMECTVYVVPSDRAVTLENSPTVDEELRYSKDLLWELDFHEAEDYLLSFVDMKVKKAFAVLQVLLEVSLDVYGYLKHTLLWCLEEHGLALGPDNSSLVDKLNVLLGKLKEFLINSHIPHYFVSKINLLTPGSEDLQSDLLSSIESLESSLTDTVYHLTGLSHIGPLDDELMSKSHELLRQSLNSSLHSVAQHNASLIVTQLYQKLHSCTTVSRSLTFHQQTLSSLNSQSAKTDQRITGLLQDFVHSSLGNMYFVHGLESYFKKEKQAFFDRAKEHFAQIVDPDLPFSRIRSAFMDLRTGQFQKVVDCLSPILGRLVEKRRSEEDSEEGPTLPESVSKDSLTQTFVDTLSSMDFLMMRLERRSAPRSISKNLALAHNQLLGCARFPVSSLDLAILCGCLLADAHSGLQDFAKASRVLEQVEDFCLKDELDLNEKRGCVYLNILSEAYIKARNEEQARYLLERSVKIMPNPRNPGRWTLMSVRTQRAREFVMGGVGVAVATAVAAATINFLLAKK